VGSSLVSSTVSATLKAVPWPARSELIFSAANCSAAWLVLPRSDHSPVRERRAPMVTVRVSPAELVPVEVVPLEPASPVVPLVAGTRVVSGADVAEDTAEASVPPWKFLLRVSSRALQFSCRRSLVPVSEAGYQHGQTPLVIFLVRGALGPARPHAMVCACAASSP
jgi:hypothetical protein